MRDEKLAPLNTLAWEARSRICRGEKARRVGYRISVRIRIDVFSSQSPLPQQARWLTSFFVTAHFRTCLICGFIVQERIKEHSTQEGSSMLLIY